MQTVESPVESDTTGVRIDATFVQPEPPLGQNVTTLVQTGPSPDWTDETGVRTGATRV